MHDMNLSQLLSDSIIWVHICRNSMRERRAVLILKNVQKAEIILHHVAVLHKGEKCGLVSDLVVSA